MTIKAEFSEDQPVIIGHLDYIKDGRAYGWACNTRSYADRLTIEIICQGRVVGRGIASEHRTDLEKAGYGDGTYAFVLPLSYELSNGNVHKLSARDASTRRTLDGEPIEFGPMPSQYNFDLIDREEGLTQLSDIITRSSSCSLESRRANYVDAYHLSALLQETGSLFDARFAWESLDKAVGTHALFQCKIGEIHLLNGEFDKALKIYLKAASEDLTSIWAHLGIGNSYRLLGMTAAARSAYEVAESLHPNNEMIRLRLTEPVNTASSDAPGRDNNASDFQSIAGLLVQSTSSRSSFEQPAILVQKIRCEAADVLRTEKFKKFSQELGSLKKTLDKMDALRDLKNHE